MRGRWLVYAALASVVSGCATVANQAVPSSSHQRVTTSPSLAADLAKAEPRPALRALARRHHATFVAGPKRGPAGLFGAYSVVKSIAASHNPENTLTVLRWANGRWIMEARLHASQSNGFWDFPVNSLAADVVDGASTEAPVFDGGEGGGGGFGLMVAVRRQQRWSWARFQGCPAARGCPPLVTHSHTAGNGSIVHGQLIGVLGNCQPDCADSTVTYENHYTWKAALGTFLLTRQVQHQRTAPSR